MKGSVVTQGNFVCDTAKSATCGIVMGLRGVFNPKLLQDTGSGGLQKYDTITGTSPFDSTASTRGLKTGTAAVLFAMLEIVSNPNNVSLDCSVVDGALTETGGSLIFNNVAGTGALALYNTPFTIGPTQRFKCGSITDPAAGFDANVLLISAYSEVDN